MNKCKEINDFREEMMSANGIIEPENCILFGQKAGQELGLHTIEFANQLVIGKWGVLGTNQYYISENLYRGASSAIIAETYGNFSKKADMFREKGIKVHYLDFENTEAKGNARYNPFLHAEHFGSTKEQAAKKLARLILDSFLTADKSEDPYWNNLSEQILPVALTVAIMYVLAGDVPDSKRTFKTLFEALQTIDSLQNLKTLAVKSKISEQNINEMFQNLNSVRNLNSEFFDKTFKGCVIGLIVDLQWFAMPNIEKCFEEETDTDNIDLFRFGTEQHYLFLTDDFCNSYSRLINFLIAAFHEGLVSLRSNLQSIRHVQFYLDELLANDIPNLVDRLAVCRQYNIGFSVVFQYVTRLKRKLGEKWESFLNCFAAFIFLNEPMSADCSKLFDFLWENNSNEETKEMLKSRAARIYDEEYVTAFVNDRVIVCDPLCSLQKEFLLD